MLNTDAQIRLRPTWVEFNPEAIAHNVRRLKQIVGEHVALMAVVKADGYGHGASAVARAALSGGASYLAVANLEEALLLREAGIRAPLLILSYADPAALPLALEYDLTLTVYDRDLAAAYERAALRANKQLPVHVKIDTGMGRLGLLPDQARAFLADVSDLGSLRLEGVYTHFSVADEDPVYTAEQARLFRSIVEPVRAAGIHLPLVHAANSAATLASPALHFDLVRVGLAMYGLTPSQKVPLPADFQPALAWKTVISSLKTLPPDHPVGYGNSYVTGDSERIAVIPVGYADGLRRAPAHCGEILVRGKRAPIIGRVSMEKTMISVSHIPECQIGDEVVLLGAQQGERITAEDIAQRLGTINYEVVCSILPRVSRAP
jgi:alanine racemase